MIRRSKSYQKKFEAKKKPRQPYGRPFSERLLVRRVGEALEPLVHLYLVLGELDTTAQMLLHVAAKAILENLLQGEVRDGHDEHSSDSDLKR